MKIKKIRNPKGNPAIFYPGMKRIGGRKKGTPNKFTSLKNSFLEAFKELGAEQGLIDWAESDPRNMAMFFRIIGGMLPKDIQMNLEGAEALASTLQKARDNKKS